MLLGLRNFDWILHEKSRSVSNEFITLVLIVFGFFVYFGIRIFFFGFSICISQTYAVFMQCVHMHMQYEVRNVRQRSQLWYRYPIVFQLLYREKKKWPVLCLALWLWCPALFKDRIVTLNDCKNKCWCNKISFEQTNRREKSVLHQRKLRTNTNKWTTIVSQTAIKICILHKLASYMRV